MSAELIYVGNCGAGWCPPMPKETYGPSAGDIAFMIIRERRKNGTGFQAALQSVRADYPQLFPNQQELNP